MLSAVAVASGWRWQAPTARASRLRRRVLADSVSALAAGAEDCRLGWERLVRKQ